MTVRLAQSDSDFDARFQALLHDKHEMAADVDRAARDIIDNVRRGGDAALIEYTEKFDRLALTADQLRISDEAMDAAEEAVPADQREALILARDRITAYHQRQMPADDRYTDEIGVELGTRWTTIESAGLYTPGGTAAYPSSVLMNAIPAKVAGVERIVMVVPTPDGNVNPLVLAAARLAGIDEIYRVGGAQAVAALAYGTETIKPVDKIVGPGNAYVAAAKRLVFGTVGIDMIAGPSDVLVIADVDNDPDWVAADLLAQAEHDAAAQATLITTSADLAGPRRGGHRSSAEDPTARRHRRSKLARPWRHHRGGFACRRRCARQPHRARASGTCRRRSGGAAPERPERRSRLPRPAHAGSDRRLSRRAQPRSADGRLGALFLRPVGV